ISMINTLLGMAVDVDRRRPVLTNVTGGLSGPAIKPVALALLWKVRQAVSIPIMGLGGISTARDSLEFIIAGANAIQIGTATFVQPAGAEDVVAGIEEYCRSAGVSRVADLTGTMEW
ncbi:MAG: nitronate monooxygenase, partial [Candidatus Latescibacterota bacterium]|nr:nitronate monooxygenase [Candidatus Latescibacterota bacterium]